MKESMEKIQKALDIEIEAIQHFRKNLDPNLERAIDAFLNCSGKAVITGVGKSGDIAKKIASTMASTGTPAIFIHPTDASHGDSGNIQEGDVVLAIGKSGESEELLAILPTIRTIGATLIALTANPNSRLATESDIVIITPVLQEACPLALAPTSSTTIALMLGDAIAMCLMELKGFQKDDFALYHPAGRLGKRLSLRVDDVMRKDERCATVREDATLEDILHEISSRHLGATAVTNDAGTLLGFITDFDIRNWLSQSKGKLETTAKEIMNPNPSRFASGRKAYDVLVEMENRERPISVAPVVDSSNQLLGIILLHDLLQKGL